MKIRFLQDCKYPQNDASQSREYKSGEVHDLPADHANRWLRRGVAEEVKTEPKKAKSEEPKAEEPKHESKPIQRMVPTDPR